MPILRKLKSLLGVDDDGDDAERDVTVTVEHDPENEAAVKGAEVEESSPGGDGDSTTVTEGSETTERTAEEADTEDEEAAEDAEDDEESPDEVEIPDAEEPTGEAAEADADDESETAEEDDTGAEAELEDAEAEAETETEDEDSATGEPVDVLNGIGPAYAQRLGDAGIDSVAELADADAAELSDATEIAEGRIQNWIDQAAEH